MNKYEKESKQSGYFEFYAAKIPCIGKNNCKKSD